MPHDFGEPAATQSGGPQPRIPAAPSATQARLPHAPTPKFFYRSHPKRWMCVDGEWLPQLGTLKLDLGVGGVDKGGAIDHAVIDSEKRGWRLIPWDVIPGTYIREWDCNGGVYHCSRWETPRYIADRPLESRVDEAGFRHFLRMLVDDGHVAPPDPDVLEQIHLDAQNKRISRLIGESHKPGVVPILEAEKAKGEAMAEAIEELRTAPAPKRKSKAKTAEVGP